MKMKQNEYDEQLIQLQVELDRKEEQIELREQALANQEIEIERLSLELDRRDQVERVYVKELRRRNEIIQAMRNLLSIYLASD